MWIILASLVAYDGSVGHEMAFVTRYDVLVLDRDLPGGAMLLSLMTGSTKYTAIPVPALVIFANPHSQGTWVDDNTDRSVQVEARAYSTALVGLTEKQEKAVQDAVPSAHVITLPGANHFVFLSNEVDVLREMSAFLAGLH